MDLNKLPYYPNILLISGNGRNVGKTTLTCAIIEHFKQEQIIAVKISPHHHHFNPEEEDVLYQTDDFIIIEEQRKNTGKDSSKYKAAGAYRVFFIMVSDFCLQEAFNKLSEHAGKDYPMIVESAALRNILIPSKFLLLSHVDRSKPKKSIEHLLPYVDQRVTLFHNYHDFDPSNLDYLKGKWSFNID